MAAHGVPDEVGMQISGHHTVSGYSTYDRTQALKLAAASLVSSNPQLSYEEALKEVSKTFIADKVVGSAMNLKPLTRGRTKPAHTTTDMIRSSRLGTLVEKITGQSSTISMVKRIPVQAGTGSAENQITISANSLDVMFGFYLELFQRIGA